MKSVKSAQSVVSWGIKKGPKGPEGVEEAEEVEDVKDTCRYERYAFAREGRMDVYKNRKAPAAC